jgi:hypothetical protein
MFGADSRRAHCLFAVRTVNLLHIRGSRPLCAHALTIPFLFLARAELVDGKSGMSGAIMETFRKYGLDWEQVAQHMHLGTKEACLLAFSSIGLASSPFDQSAMSLPDRALLPATFEGMRFRGSDDALLRRRMSYISASIGPEAAAAGAEASIAEHRGHIESKLPQGTSVEESETATRAMQDAGCKGALVAAIAARSKVLAHREVCLAPPPSCTIFMTAPPSARPLAPALHQAEKPLQEHLIHPPHLSSILLTAKKFTNT